ncbi:hypothetical protein H7F15_07765 [Pontibacter sp. Tf4]|uniref:hypothetical protein n=1 Tax=Pontibacter sp. Tf4 TaxID=2761620 RepID=UPI001627F6D0|nr:hypothetical protein [Pontibacter sp. Tf4]MBB6610928.1 hypothetical protein [Pontibacter sp. Tf4]
MQIIKKAYYYSYCILNGFARNMYDDGYSTYKAVFLLVAIQVMWLSVLCKYWGLTTDYSPYSTFNIGMGIVLYNINYYLIKKNWGLSNPPEEYASFSIPTKLIWCAFLMALGVAGLFFNMYINHVLDLPVY